MPPALLAVVDAQTRLFALAPAIPSETVPLAHAIGRWTTDAIPARRTQPEADLSAMDGYAIRYEDLPGPFALVGESAAGHAFSGAVGAGETVRIFTGAALPPGTDTILVQEEATRDGDTIHLTGEGPARHASSVRPRGLDFSTGDILIAKGERLTPAALALGALGGHATLPVARRLTVAIAATGDELARPGSGDPAKLPETNGLMLAALLRDLPVDIIDLGIIPDDLAVMTAAFAAVRADILVTTGGASVGDHDLVRPALEAAGGTIDFWKIALRPGKPMMAGRLGDAVVLGLPGNPVSAFVTATIFLRPLVAAMSGAADPLPRTFAAPLGEPLRANDHRTDYLRAELRDGRVHASTIQDSSMLRTLARADCLVLRPAHAPAAEIGELVDILPLA
ncbi:molybdenum cofactor biosynthesis protein MoeA [Sphingomonas sp. Leaf357]|uniref:molybdopterin molybdotransferase MoeA n=1 Tax=Sphingomonas sp. Leaf357 TaxID=1736350 RepID=UPI0006F55C16|nr:molybdopterin molybdotransferase MoeA [Sphingomonas sp. Leaf357]KQS04624.1 molybdenum cofactor biosynthesis protein MoeA [Sphingomonas sp. Leaf357]